MTRAPAVLEALRQAFERVLVRADVALHRLRRHAGTEVADRAGAAAEAAHRAAEVPREVIQDAERALAAWSRSALAMLGVLLTLVVFGSVLLVLLTVGLVVALNGLLGDPWGTFATFALYLVAAAVLILALRRAARAGADEAKAALAPRTGAEGPLPPPPRSSA